MPITLRLFAAGLLLAATVPTHAEELDPILIRVLETTIEPTSPGATPPPEGFSRGTPYGMPAGRIGLVTDYPVTAHDQIHATRAQLIQQLQALQDEYCRRAMLDEAVAVREQIRQLRRMQSIPLPPFGPQPAEPRPAEPWTYPMQVRGQNGHSFYARVTGSKNGSIWGTGIYTDDSDLAKAAVHAGLVEVDQTRIVRFTVLPGQTSYAGSDAHGVQSFPYGTFSGSYCIDGVGVESVQPSQYREQVGTEFTVYVTGSTTGSIYGTGTYTDDSDIPTAAVHAGLLQPGESKFLTLRIAGPQDQFAATVAHGISSYDYGAWSGSFTLARFRPVADLSPAK